MKIQLDQIQPSPHPVRSTWDEDKLNELAQSLREQGQIVPVIVRPSDGQYELIDGHRRVEAARRANFEAIEAIVKEMSDLDALFEAIIANIQRDDTTAIDEGRTYKLIQTEYGVSGAKIAERIGKSQQWVTRCIALIDDPILEIIDHQHTGGLADKAEAIRAVGDDIELRKAVAQKMVNEDLGVKQIRRVAQSVAAAPSPEAKQNLIEREYTPIIHDPEFIKERAQQYGANDALYRPYTPKAEPSRDWQNLPEVIQVIDSLKSWTEKLELFQRVSTLGKMSPEARRFIAGRVRTFANRLIEWAGDLENG